MWKIVKCMEILAYTVLYVLLLVRIVQTSYYLNGFNVKRLLLLKIAKSNHNRTEHQIIPIISTITGRNYSDFVTGNKSVIKLSTTSSQSKTHTNMQFDLHFAERLRTAQKNDSLPLVNDIIVTTHNNVSAVYVIINNGNTMNEYRYLTNVSVELRTGLKSYSNQFPQIKEYPIRLLKYVVSSLPKSGTISLFDHSTSYLYKDLPYISIPKATKRKIAICSYISDYNSIYEIKSFLAYYLIQKVDLVIFYCCQNYQYFMKSLQKEIESGYIVLYHFPWPLTMAYNKIQRSVQVSHINSCYYRHRNYFEYIISQDIDEYIYSEKYPFNLYGAIKYNSKIHPKYKTFAVIYIRQLHCR